jgi:hypothetical protein
MLSAEQLLDRIREKGGRVYRMRRERVCVLTGDESLAGWLIGLGGKPYGHGHPQLEHGGYFRSPGVAEYDIWINEIRTVGEETIWEALGADS